MRGEEPKLKLAIQFASGVGDLPSRARLRRWIRTALSTNAEIAVRFVNEAEARKLNRDFRGWDQATNVLSFLLETGPPIVGDIALCLPLARKEAKDLRINVDARIAHLLIHAVLHLQGYDHEIGEEAEAMERMETAVLRKLGFSDPYAEEVNYGRGVKKPGSSSSLFPLTPHSSLT